MKHHLINWKSVSCKAYDGSFVELSLARLVDLSLRGKLLSEILSMPLKNPISFEDAIRILSDKESELFLVEKFGTGPGQYGWYSDHFVEWISSLGFHIEITGEEFEPAVMTDKLA